MELQTKAHRTIFTEPNDREIVATHVYDAPREQVWQAYTDPGHVPHWALGPEGWHMPVCEIDLRPGGEWHWVWESEAGERLEMRGQYLEVVAPERLVNTESWGPDWPETVNTLELAEGGGGTVATTTVRYPSTEARDAAVATGMKDGWAQSDARLDEYLASMG